LAEPVRVSLHVDATSRGQPITPIWTWFGYDEPNYTYQRYGRQLLRELAALGPGPVHVRAHNLLTSGDGTPALKWGSTNAYTEDSAGQPVYSWAILDRIFDTYVEAGITPFVQAGFMPEALSTGPPPYRHDFPRTGITTGWAWPPRDYVRWGELIDAWARHLVERYGMARVKSWPWEIWNEPDGLYWRGSAAEFCRLHDVADCAIRQAIPEARIGGPHTCGPRDTQAAEFLRTFLDHCAKGTNFANGRTGTRLDFIAFHAKGRPTIVESHVRMGIAEQLQSVAAGLDIVREFPAFDGVPVILGESDPEGCAACPTRTHPQNAYRDGPLYGASVVEAIARTLELSERAGVRIDGAVTWAFEFEGEPYFAGYRELATNGIPKAVFNAFRMLSMLKGERLAATSSGALPLATILTDGVVGAPDIDLIATRDETAINVLVWNYHDDDLPAAGAADIELTLNGVTNGPLLCRHFRMDRVHSNAHATFLAHGSPQRPSAAQYAELQAAGRLALMSEPETLPTADGRAVARFALPRHAVSFLAFSPT
jgi:xylan 1,4-beta-xylosidase